MSSLVRTPTLGCSALSMALIACGAQGSDHREQKAGAYTSGASVFINEFHYDNASTDTGEAIEIAGPAGTDLAHYGVVLYNGANGSAYDTIALTGTLTDEGQGYGTSVITFPNDGIQNGAPEGIALTRGSTLLSFISYEGSFTAVGGPADGQTSSDIGVAQSGSTPIGASLQRTGEGYVDTDFTWVSSDSSSFGSVNEGQTFGDTSSGTHENGGDGGDHGNGGNTGSIVHDRGTGGNDADRGNAGNGGDRASGGDDGSSVSRGLEFGGCGDPATSIPAVQGHGFASPLLGDTVVIEGVVVADFQGGAEQLGGFYVQSLEADSDPSTSEGVFVYDLGLETDLDVTVGQKVRVGGTVLEFEELTEISAEQVQACGSAVLPAPALLPLPYDESIELEALEGMLVQSFDLVAADVYNLGRYGEVLLAVDGRLFNSTNGNGRPPGENSRFSIVLDDARDFQNQPVPYLGEGGTLRLGDNLPSITAVLSYGFGAYRLQPLERDAIEFRRANPRTSQPDDVGGDVRIASLNVLNYFTTNKERGADTQEELERQRAKLVSTIVAMKADVVGLMEIENNNASNQPAALDDFVASINQVVGAPMYARAPDPAYTGTDQIRSAIIYRPSKVTALDVTLSDDAPVFDIARPSIAQGFSYHGNVFSVVVSHFKSKGCGDATGDDLDEGQGCYNAARTAQAEALLDFVDELQCVSGDEDVIVLGDLNSYLKEDPVIKLESELSNVVTLLPTEEQYSYAFFGELGLLDYAMTTPALEVSGVTIWHINSDEPRVLDYNTENNPPELYKPDPFRSSDHDPLVIGLDLTPEPGTPIDTLADQVAKIAGEAELRRGPVRQWQALLEIVERGIEEGEKYDETRPLHAALARGLAQAALIALRQRVRNFERRGLISGEQSEALQSAAKAIATSHGGPGP